MSKSFLGTGWGFPPTFDEENLGVLMVSDDEDIRQSLFILFSTTPGERVTKPNYGCDLHRIVFQPTNASTQVDIVNTVSRAVARFEPRVKVEAVSVDMSGALDGVVYIKVFYTVITTNIRTNIVFPFYKIEGTDIREI